MWRETTWIRISWFRTNERWWLSKDLFQYNNLSLSCILYATNERYCGKSKYYFNTCNRQLIINWVNIQHFHELTLIGKSCKTRPEIFLKLSVSGSSHRPFYWKTHPLKIMRTYSVFAILGHPTDRFAGKFIHSNNLIKITEPVNIVIAAILLHALTTLKYCVETVLHHKLWFII